MLKAEVKMPWLFASRDTPHPVLVRFSQYFPVDWNKKTNAASARLDEGGMAALD
jgi:hypothetical protein